jgi:hypothetical protein
MRPVSHSPAISRSVSPLPTSAAALECSVVARGLYDIVNRVHVLHTDVFSTEPRRPAILFLLPGLRQKQQSKMLLELLYRTIERIHGSIRPGEHHPAFHHCQNVGREPFDVCSPGQAIRRCFQTFANRSNPSLEILCDQLVRWPVFWIDLQRQSSKRTAIPAFSDQNPFPITG